MNKKLNLALVQAMITARADKEQLKKAEKEYTDTEARVIRLAYDKAYIEFANHLAALHREHIEEELLPRTTKPLNPTRLECLGVLTDEYDWLEARHHTEDGDVCIGGSDAGTVLLQRSCAALKRQKTEPVKMEQVNPEERAILDYGHDNEERILAEFAAREQLDIRIDKATYHSKAYKGFSCNVDGVLYRRGKPAGIVEVKTGWNLDKWLDEEGNPTLPPKYKVQLLWYLFLTNLKEGHLIAEVEGDKLFHFTVEADAEINDKIGTLRANLHKIYTFQSSVKAAQKMSQALPTINPEVKLPDLGKYARVFIVDLETTGFSGISDDIIEVGLVDVTRGIKFNALYSPKADVLAAKGTGAVHCHGITCDLVKYQPVFTLDDLVNILNLEKGEGDILMIAHNAAFEKRWLGKLQEYVPAGVQVDWLDSMQLCRDYCVNSESNTLKSFAEWGGEVYPLNSHQAVVDCVTTQKALAALYRKYDQESVF